MLDIAERSVFDVELWESQERHLQATSPRRKRQKVWVVSPRLKCTTLTSIRLIDINIALRLHVPLTVTGTVRRNWCLKLNICGAPRR
jgi:hypothetical protein